MTPQEALLKEVETRANHAFNPLKLFDYPEFYEDQEEHQRCAAKVHADMRTILVNAVAWRLTGNHDYSEKAVNGINAWCAVNKGWKNTFRKTHALEFIVRTTPMVESMQLLKLNGELWENWINEHYIPTAELLAKRKNNWGAWGIYALVMADIAMDQKGWGNYRLQNVTEWLDNATTNVPIFGDDKELWRENMRTNSGLWYTYFALSPIARVCYELKKRSIEYPVKLVELLDRFYFYATNPEVWPYHLAPWPISVLQKWIWPCADSLETTMPGSWGSDIFEALSGPLNRPQWSEYVAPARPITYGDVWTSVITLDKK